MQACDVACNSAGLAGCCQPSLRGTAQPPSAAAAVRECRVQLGLPAGSGAPGPAPLDRTTPLPRLPALCTQHMPAGAANAARIMFLHALSNHHVPWESAHTSERAWSQLQDTPSVGCLRLIEAPPNQRPLAHGASQYPGGLGRLGEGGLGGVLALTGGVLTSTAAQTCTQQGSEHCNRVSGALVRRQRWKGCTLSRTGREQGHACTQRGAARWQERAGASRRRGLPQHARPP